MSRGAPDAPECGARTRNGSACQQPPIKEGNGRCLNHAGPHAARKHRETQLRAFRAGKISSDEWNRAEARRAANRLGWLWKKNPWVPGRTIDLGAHEAEFVAELQGRGLDVEALPPAVADWLRWRFRRTMLDRRDEKAWLRVLVEALPLRVAKAGPRPEGDYMETTSGTGTAWSVGSIEASSKRARADQPRAPKVIRGKGYGRRGRPRTQPPTDNETENLMAVYRAHRDVVAPMFERCSGEGERLSVLRALRDYTENPNAPGPRERWLALARAFSPFALPVK